MNVRAISPDGISKTTCLISFPAVEKKEPEKQQQQAKYWSKKVGCS